MDIQNLSNPDNLYEMDKSTISENQKTEFLQELSELETSYIDYNTRVPDEILIVAVELKREIDQTVTPRLQEMLGKLSVTQDRFSRLYSDVRIYPREHELAQLTIDKWEGCILDAYVSFVIAVPPEERLDSLSRTALVSLFSEDPSISDEEASEIDDIDYFRSNLSLETISSLLNEIRFPGFYGENFQGLALEIIIDACADADYEIMAEAAKRLGLKPDCFSAEDPANPNVPIQPDEVEEKVPQLIASIAGKIGVQGVNPDKLKHGQSLFALMDFDHRLTLSLTQSISMHFGVMGTFGGERMITVGNAIEFAEMFIDGQDGMDDDD